MKKRYIKLNIGLLAEYDENKADNPSFWDKHWMQSEISNSIKKAEHNGLAAGSKYLRKYLDKNSIILEAGCGRGQNVVALQKLGYSVFGVDNARETIKLLNKVAPYLNISYGDVRNLEFSDNKFTHYFSLGVIEHFEDKTDVERIVEEAKRVTSDVIFISVPFLSDLLQRNFEMSKKKSTYGHFFQYYYSKKAITKLLINNGLEPFDYSYYASYITLKRHSNSFKLLYSNLKIFRFIVQKLIVLIDRRLGYKYGHMIGVWCRKK